MAHDIDLDEITRRESEQVEWKENVGDIDDVVATLVAFANDLQNLGGGYVVCGAREVKDANGFPSLVRVGLTAQRLKEVEHTVLARCRDRVSPPLTPLLAELPGEDVSRRILVFVLPASDSAHTFRRGQESARYFVRVGRSTIEARNGVLRNLLVRKRALEPWDRRICPGATESDLDLLAVRDTLQRMKIARGDLPPERYLSDEVAFSAFVPPLLLREGLTGVLRPRNFAILLFGRNPQHFIPGAVSFFSRYDGLDRAVPRGERLELASTLVDQLRLMLPSVEAEAHTLYDKNDPDQPSVTRYPTRALREAVVNGYAHRDYELVDPLRVTAFKDRIEIVSPGALPFGVELADLTTGTASPLWRNQTLAWFLSRLGFAEAEGHGIRTIQATLRETGCPPAVYRADAVRVSCTLWAHPRSL